MVSSEGAGMIAMICLIAWPILGGWGVGLLVFVHKDINWGWSNDPPTMNFLKITMLISLMIGGPITLLISFGDYLDAKWREKRARQRMHGLGASVTIPVRTTAQAWALYKYRQGVAAENAERLEEQKREKKKDKIKSTRYSIIKDG